MNVHVSALKEQHDRYQAVRARLWFSKAPKAAPIVVITPEPVKKIMLARRPAWKMREVNFDLHVLQYRDRLLNLNINPIAVYIADRCRELGVSFEALKVPCRSRSALLPRQLLMWEIRQKFNLSYPRMGQLFGGLDHTTCISAVRRVETLKARGEL